MPAGFMEVGEPPAGSPAGEVMEETGLTVETGQVFESWAGAEDPRTPMVCYAFSGRLLRGALKSGEGATDAAFVSRRELPDNITFSSHRHTIENHYLGTGRAAPDGRPHGGSRKESD